jgi:hypothetical protein
MMFVRGCYARVLKIVESLYAVRQRGAGVIFTGAQGNSKVQQRMQFVFCLPFSCSCFSPWQSWCALFLVWHMLWKGRTVVYEIVEEDAVFIITSDGVVRRGEGAAKIPYLNDENTVHIFDAKATETGAREPAMSDAFLVEFSSENSASFEQTSRRPAVVRYCIPSYTLGELLTVHEYFGVSEDEVRARVAQIGPSIRYVLVNDYAETFPATMDKAKNVTTAQFQRFLSPDASASLSEKDVSAGLLIVQVNEDDYPEEPWQAYKRFNASWSSASRNICQIVYKNTCTKAQKFVRQFITEVNTPIGLTRLKGVAGNFLVLMVEDFLTAREFQARRLCDDVPGPLPLLPHCFWPEWLTVPENKLVLRAGEGLSIQRALEMNRDPRSLSSFCKNLTGVDYLACDGLLAFQVTTSLTHPVSFDALSAICAHAREHYPGQTVKLIFVVPDELISRAGTGPWRMTQSLHATTQVDADGTTRKVGRYSKFDKLDAEQKAMLANLEQWVVAYTA